MQPALQTSQGFARPLTAGDGGQDLGHGGIGRDEAFAPRTQQEHLQPGFLFGAEGALLELGEQQTGDEEPGDHEEEVDAEEAAFVQAQLKAPVDIENLVANTPDGLRQQVYAMSVMAIDLDTQDEAQYLHKLASAYGMQPAQVNEIHAQLGVPSLYT